MEMMGLFTAKYPIFLYLSQESTSLPRAHIAHHHPVEPAQLYTPKVMTKSRYTLVLLATWLLPHSVDTGLPMPLMLGEWTYLVTPTIVALIASQINKRRYDIRFYDLSYLTTTSRPSTLTLE